MRRIYAEKLFEKLGNIKPKNKQQYEDIGMFMEMVTNSPTVEEQPHGEWLNEDYGIGECYAECSECGESTDGEAKDNGFGYDYSFPNFCPNCGASMVKKEGDEK